MNDIAQQEHGDASSDQAMPEESFGSRAAGLLPLAPITVVLGHYGVGKTNFSINLSIDAASHGQKVALADLDVVNPYFRSSDYTALLEHHGIEMIAPVMAGTTLDSPSLSGRVSTSISGADTEHPLVIDAGGDDVGATALGRFAGGIEAKPHAVYYVVNAFRNLTQDPEEAVELLAAIEAKARLKATAVIDNSHLKEDTTAETIAEGREFAESVARLLELPLLAVTVPTALSDSTAVNNESGYPILYPVSLHVRTPWESFGSG